MAALREIFFYAPVVVNSGGKNDFLSNFWTTLLSSGHHSILVPECWRECCTKLTSAAGAHAVESHILKALQEVEHSLFLICTKLLIGKDKANTESEEKRRNEFSIKSELGRIRKILAQLPESNRAVIQPCFSGLCADTADIALSK
ncbi:hypothetical protein Tco_0089080 [Tanacetum coccineum]